HKYPQGRWYLHPGRYSSYRKIHHLNSRIGPYSEPISALAFAPRGDADADPFSLRQFLPQSLNPPGGGWSERLQNQSERGHNEPVRLPSSRLRSRPGHSPEARLTWNEPSSGPIATYPKNW